jgi:hypothetical protein
MEPQFRIWNGLGCFFTHTPGSLLPISTVITTALTLAEELKPQLRIASGPRPPRLIKSLVVRPKLQVACF